MFSLFHLYRKPCCFSTLVAHCCPEATNQYFVQGWGGTHFMMDILSGTPKLPKNGVTYFFPPKIKSHAIEG